jgi:hypothetical protein
MSEVNEQLRDLAARMLQATTKGDLGWEDVSDTAFETTLGSSSVIIRSRDKDGAHPYTLELINSNGVVVDSITSNASGDPWMPDYSVLEPLYEVARRKALDVDAVIAEALGLLPPVETDDEPPF